MKLFRMAACLAVVLAMSACAYLPDSAATADAKRAVQVALTTYADVYQPAVIVYGSLPACPQATICHDPVILGKLKAADLAVTKSISAAQAVLEGKASDVGQLAAALSAVQTAEIQIAASGAITQAKGN